MACACFKKGIDKGNKINKKYRKTEIEVIYII